ncbi:MAG: LysR substrate-binding domain-containing protein [Pseudomonadota bacterium]
MARRHYDLPPLTALAAFETAGRLGSFKRAASELNVTPGAVSHQIRVLEQDTGTILFNRRHRGVDLTREGELLYDVVSRGFGEISAVLRRLRTARHDVPVAIGATTAVSSLWLTPRLGRFWQSHPGIAVTQHVSDQEFDRGPALDLQILYRDRHRVPATARRLFDDVLVPLVSPEFAADTRVQDLDALAHLPLIHILAEDVTWTTWASWFSGLGFRGSIRRAHSVNNYTIALQIARDGGGVVLGWERLVSPLIERGVLVSLGPWRLPAPQSFYILAESEPAEPVSILLDWLIASVAEPFGESAES